jgi:hypothetical protein
MKDAALVLKGVSTVLKGDYEAVDIIPIASR